MKLLHFGDLNGGVLLDADFGDTLRDAKHGFNKPRYRHTLWTSPVDSGFGWKDWCRDESWGDPEALQWHLTLAPSTRLLVIKNRRDIVLLERQYRHCKDFGPVITCIDWPRVAEDYDAIHLMEYALWDDRFGHPDLYGWDCETVVLFRAAHTATAIRASIPTRTHGGRT